MSTVIGRAGAVIATAKLNMPGTADLEYDSAEPMAVMMTVQFGPLWEPASYEFARVLLDAALSVPSKQFGYGDVKVEVVSHLAVRFIVRAPELADGWRTFLVNRDELEDFMVRTFVMVPAVNESMDVDHAIERILTEAS